MSAGGGCEVAVTVRARCGSVNLVECGELLYKIKVPLKQKGAVYKSYIRPMPQNECSSKAEGGCL